MFRQSGRRKKNSSLFQPSVMSGRRGARRHTRRMAMLVCVVALVLIAAGIVFARSEAGGAFWRVAAPLYAVESSIASHAQYIFAPFQSKERLAAQNAALQSQIAALETDAANNALLTRENAGLKEEIGEMPASQKIILADILARPPQLPYDELIVNAGSAAGAGVGDAVGIGSALMGKVVSVAPSSARIELFSAAGISTSALLNAEVPMVLTGRGGGAFKAEVPQDTPAAVGDAASLPGAPLYTIAVVQHIDAENGSSFKELYLSLPADVFSLPHVEILPTVSVPPFEAASSSPSV